MPTEIAHLSPTQVTGSGIWLDLWNADLFWGESGVNHASQANEVQFRASRYTWNDNLEVGAPNGIAQAIFDTGEDYHLFVVRLSSAPSTSTAPVQILVDGVDAGMFEVTGQGVDIPVVGDLSAGRHSVTVIQEGTDGGLPSAHLWFHGVTCFTI